MREVTVMQEIHKLSASKKQLVFIQLSGNFLRHKKLQYLFQANHVTTFTDKEGCWIWDDLCAGENYYAKISGRDVSELGFETILNLVDIFLHPAGWMGSVICVSQ
jgi:hypothetical protein